MSHQGAPFGLQILGVQGADARERMIVAKEHHPIHGAELERPEVARAETGWRNKGVETSRHGAPQQRSAVGLDHGELDSGPLLAESQQQLRARGHRAPAASPASGSRSPRPRDHARGERHVGCGHGHPRALEEQLSGLRQVDPTWVALEQLNTELGFEPAHLGREPGWATHRRSAAPVKLRSSAIAMK